MSTRHDWLGPGIYFWVDSPEGELNRAREQAARKSHQVKKLDVIDAFIYPGLCLNLTDCGVKSELLDGSTVRL